MGSRSSTMGSRSASSLKMIFFLLKDFTGQIGATSSDIYQNVCLYVQLQNPVDDIVADEY